MDDTKDQELISSTARLHLLSIDSKTASTIGKYR
jgi:hypothetical protein